MTGWHSSKDRRPRSPTGWTAASTWRSASRSSPLARLGPELGLTPEQEGELAYERLAEGGARLRLTTDHVVTDAAERHQPRYRHLLTWELPPV